MYVYVYATSGAVIVIKQFDRIHLCGSGTDTRQIKIKKNHSRKKSIVIDDFSSSSSHYSSYTHAPNPSISIPPIPLINNVAYKQ